MAEYEVGDETIEITPPEYMKEAARAAEKAQEEDLVPGECGTGVGDDRADQIKNDEVGPDVVDEVASYLTSHEEDRTAEGHPRSWTEEEWSDCGNAQLAKWGDSGDSRAKEWAQRKANEVAEARGEEIPYPEVENNTMKSFNYEIGDFVSWEFGDGESKGEIIDKTDEEGDSMSAGGNEVSVEDSENPVYKIQEWDEELGEEGEFDNLVVKREDSLSSAERPDAAPETAPQNQNSVERQVNQLSVEEMKEIKEKAGTDDAPKVHKHFQVNSKDIKQGEDDDGNPIYKVPISGDAQDRDEDQMALEGQEDMVRQLKTGKVPVFGDHGRAADAPRYSFTNILGQFVGGELSNIQDTEKNEGEKVTLADMRVRRTHPDSQELMELLEGEWPVGFSVGFIPQEVEEVRNENDEMVGLKMKKVDLLEASAVGIPSQPDSVPVGIDTNSTQAALAVKNILDEASEEGKEVDVDSLEKGLQKSILEREPTMSNEEDSGDGDGKDSSFVEENRESFKTLIKEGLREFKSEELKDQISQKAPGDVGRGDVLSFVVDHFDGAEVSDVESGLPDDSEYIGELDLNAYANLLAVLGDVEQGEAQQVLENVLDEMMEEGEENEMDEDEEDEEEENDQNPEDENETDEDEDEEDDEDEEMSNQFEGLDVEVDEFKQRVSEELGTEPEEIDLSRPVTELSEEEFKAMRKVAEDMEGLSEDDLTDVSNSSGPKGSGPIHTGEGEGDDGKSDSGDGDEKEMDFSFGGTV